MLLEIKRRLDFFKTGTFLKWIYFFTIILGFDFGSLHLLEDKIIAFISWQEASEKQLPSITDSNVDRVIKYQCISCLLQFFDFFQFDLNFGLFLHEYDWVSE